MKHDLKSTKETARASRHQQQRVAEEQRMREIQLEYERKEREMQEKMDRFKREFEESQLKIRQKQEISIQECYPKMFFLRGSCESTPVKGQLSLTFALLAFG
jgi:hypothetical protein